MPMPSHRGWIMPESPIRKLVPLARQAEAKGLKIYHLNIGQPDIKTPQEGLDALKNIDRSILEYTQSEGLLSLRTKLADYYRGFNIDVAPEEIIITTGGSEAVLFAFMACLDQGDEIIVPEPAYANYTAFAISGGAIIRPLLCSIENDFALPPFEEFERMITKRTRAILLCNPNNPTGHIYTPEEMEHIRQLVKKYDLYLFSDEVYREFCYTDTPHISAMQLKGIEDNVILIDSVSKRYSECGIRIGALITKNKQVRKDVMKFCQARLCPPLIGQIVAEASMDASEAYMKSVYDEYLERRNYMIAAINEIPGCYSPMPKGAFYTVAHLPIDDADKFCAWLLESFEYEGKTLMIAPASGFYSSNSMGRNEVRMAYVMNIDDLKISMELLRRALEVYPGRTM